MKKTLLNDLRNVTINVGPQFPPRNYSIHEDLKEKVIYSIHEDLKEKVIALKNESADRYRKFIIDDYAEQNEIVRRGVEDKLKFYDVGESIIQRANEIYESKKNDGFKFKRKEVLEVHECLNSVEQLERIVDVGDYFRKGRVSGKIGKLFLTNMFAKKKFERIIPLLFWGGAGVALGNELIPPEIYDPALSSFGVKMTSSLIGGLFGLFIPSIYSLNENTSESLIKKPAEKLGKDLNWLDETFDRIYRGGEGE